MEKVIEITEKIIPFVVPSEEEVQLGRKAEAEIRRRLNEIGVEYIFVGSYARNTWLKDNLEIDVFVFFDPKVSRELLEKEGLEIGKKVLESYEVRYAEHPYVHGRLFGVEVEIVPCYKVKSAAEIKSAVDRTPFHHEWLKDRIKGKENEVRILKKFLKVNGLYGAEYKVRGFSGYLCELLIVYYGSFAELVKNATKWSRRTVIDVGKKEERTGDVFFVVDPVDEKRNVAANLSLDNLAKFVQLCRDFLKNPSEAFFFERPLKIPPDEEVLKIIELRSSSIFAVEFQKPEIVEDNLYPQLERAAKKIFEFLEKEGYKPMRYNYFANDKCYLIFECEISELSRVYKKMGPKFEDEENVESFLKKNRKFKPFIENGRWWSFELRENTKPEDSVEKFISKNWASLGKNVGEILRRDFKILKGKELLKVKEKLAEFLGVI
ncbi:MAG: CCA tRNA nucleotidyltransferase [Archaeoglobales archaeon]|nr:CCA tRNA nucleotidyltransferase [Archaeoglobales archaeon]